MNDHIDDREQLLSAHLDGRLAPKEQARLMTLLDHDPAARQSLQALDYTRNLLAATPRAPVPRAFVLNEGMAGVRAPQRDGWRLRLQPVYLRLAAAMVAVMLLVITVGDMGVRWQAVDAPSSVALQAPSGGLAPDQGNPTGILAAKTATVEEVAATPATFLGLQPATLLALEAGLAALALLLLAASWWLRRP